MARMLGVRDARLEAIYAQLPTLVCQRKCQECCGPIFVAQAEWSRIQETVPHPVRCVTHRGAQGEATLYEPTVNDQLQCPLLVNGGCSVYAVRPIICRLFGMTRGMACPWGCVPSRWLTDEEVRDIIRQVENA